MTPEQKTEAMRLAQLYGAACATDAHMLSLGGPTTISMHAFRVAHHNLDTYLDSLVQQPAVTRLDGEGSSSLD